MPESGGRPESSSRSSRLPFIKRSRIVAKPVTEYLDCVLSKQRWRKADRAGSAIYLPWRADLCDPTGRRVFDLQSHLAACRQRTGECFLHVKDRTGRNPKLLEPRQPFIARAFL